MNQTITGTHPIDRAIISLLPLPDVQPSALPDLDRPKIALVGLGPYAAATYLPYLKKIGNPPELLIELDSAREATESTLRSFELSVPTLYLNRSEFRGGELTPQAHAFLSDRISWSGITHAIIATEPRSHLGYLKFFISQGVHCLTEKPLTAEAGSSTDVRKAMKLKKDFSEIAAAYSSSAKRGLKVAIQVQRRFHPGYLFVREQVRKLSRRFNVPVTHIDLFNSDGSWNMPNEFLSREKHSYKHGYGELLHSGYHFVDLMNWIRTSASVSEEKIADYAEIQSVSTRPADQLQVLDADFYKNHLRNDYEDVFAKAQRGDLKGFGELDVHALIQFRKGARTVTTASLNLISSGFSRRAWTHLPENTFKGNGRLSHERMTIHLGPLASIIVERYQSGEESGDLTGVGQRDHFDVTVFQNTGLTGGEAMTKYSIKEITRLMELPYWSSGASDYARFQSLRNFLSDSPSESALLDHEDSIELLAALCRSVALHGQGKSSRVRAAFTNGGAA